MAGLLRRAASLTPPDSPDLPRRLHMLGAGLMATGDDDEAAAAFQHAAELGLVLDVPTALVTAQVWGDWAQSRRAWPEATRAYGIGMTALRSLVRVQLLRSEKETSLRLAGHFGAAAAYACAASGNLVEAVVSFEQGRAALLDDALQRDRADLDQLRRGPAGALAERFEQAATRELSLTAPG